jgi:Icc-related predicted phosphoesterase
MLVLGDAHAEQPHRREALRAAYRESGAEVALQAGDLGWYALPAQTYFVAGNNEDHDVVEALRRGERPPTVSNATLLASSVVTVAGLRVAGLSGNYAPTRYDHDRSQLVADRRRHFTHEDVERALELEDVDVFLTHQAPHGLPVAEEYEVGCTHVDSILRRLEPDLCLVGHHHQHVVGRFGDTRVVSLAPAWESYYVLRPETLELTRHETPST